MKKKFFLFLFITFIISFISGCDLESLSENGDSFGLNVKCTPGRQYSDSYGISYYIEGSCKNNSSNNYDYLQVEYICYDKSGNNLGTALDNTNNLLSGETWKFKAMSLGDNDSIIDHCDFYKVTGW